MPAETVIPSEQITSLCCLFPTTNQKKPPFKYVPVFTADWLRNTKINLPIFNISLFLHSHILIRFHFLVIIKYLESLCISVQMRLWKLLFPRFRSTQPIKWKVHYSGIIPSFPHLNKKVKIPITHSSQLWLSRKSNKGRKGRAWR